MMLSYLLVLTSLFSFSSYFATLDAARFCLLIVFAMSSFRSLMHSSIISDFTETSYVVGDEEFSLVSFFDTCVGSNTENTDSLWGSFS